MTHEKKVVLGVSAAMFSMLFLAVKVLRSEGSGFTGLGIRTESIATSVNYSSLLIFGLFLAMALVSSIAFSTAREKKKFSGQLEELVRRIKKSLIAEDLSGAVNGYKVLTEQFSDYQYRIPKKDVGMIYKESLELYAEIVRLQEKSRKGSKISSHHPRHSRKNI